MHIDVVGFLAPTERSLRPQLLLKVVPAQIKLDNRRAIFDRGADKGVLVYLRDNRLKLHLHGHSHPAPFASHRRATGYVVERRVARGDQKQAASTLGPEQDRSHAP
jgi:hypothetical protein